MSQRTERTSLYRAAFWLILLLGATVRIYRFGTAPAGLNQDEAFAAYEAWSLLHGGTDTAGYAWPVYLTAWGSGMNALETYLMLPFLALFGRQVWAVRLPQLLVGLLSIPALCDAVRRTADRESALWAALLLAICPWHVLLSRWGLESNLAPGFLLFGTAAFLRGLEDGRFLPLSGLLYGLSLYAYATLWPVLPAVLLCQGAYCARRGKLRIDRWLLLALLLLFLLALPLLLFLAVNLGWMGEIRTPYLSVPKLLYLRAGELSLRRIPENLGNLAAILWTQSDGLPWNSAGAYGLLYPLAAPFVLLGLLRCLARLRTARRRFEPAVLLLLWLLAGVAVGALMEVNVNRVNLIFPPLIILAAVGLRWFAVLFRGRATPLLLAAWLLCFGLFSRWYFTDYQRDIAYSFRAGLEDALDAAMHTDGEIVLDEYIYYPQVLFFSGTPAEAFRASVRYERYPAAFLSPTGFTRFRFGYTGGAPEEGRCYILSPWTDPSALEAAGYTLHTYGVCTLAVLR
ncbi:MAG: glycosyltransferase family 39 protein [Oscillospiraceae bacterium]|nr:glycosyltransferase family 39 protein [Oscillospiraceae bacterium]